MVRFDHDGYSIEEVTTLQHEIGYVGGDALAVGSVDGVNFHAPSLPILKVAVTDQETWSSDPSKLLFDGHIPIFRMLSKSPDTLEFVLI